MMIATPGSLVEPGREDDRVASTPFRGRTPVPGRSVAADLASEQDHSIEHQENTASGLANRVHSAGSNATPTMPAGSATTI